MTAIDRLTVFLGLGLFYGLKVEGLSSNFNNMTLGVHGQEWNAEYEIDGQKVNLNELYIGLLFFRLVFQFITPQ